MYPNHWANEVTILTLKDHPTVPNVLRSARKRDCILNSVHYVFLTILRHSWQQRAEVLIILIQFCIPENFTDRLQLLDLIVNKPAADFLRGKFEEWYAKQICDQGTSPITFPRNYLEPLGLKSCSLK